MVAPITSTIRGAPSEVLLGLGEGLEEPSAAHLICRALLIATGCAT